MSEPLSETPRNPTQRKCLQIRLLLTPIGVGYGALAGFGLGACYLPMLALGRLARYGSRHYEGLSAWADWAEGAPNKTLPKKGGYAWIWIPWCFLYFVFAVTWAPWLGGSLGALLGAWVTLNHGTAAAAQRWLERGQRMLRGDPHAIADARSELSTGPSLRD